MQPQSIRITATFCAALAVATFAAPAKPASADSTSTAILAGLAGLVVGSLLFDSSRHQYYYQRGGRRQYVSDSQAQQYYQHKDPKYFNAHRSTWSSNRGQFANNWNHDHGGHR